MNHDKYLVLLDKNTLLCGLTLGVGSCWCVIHTWDHKYNVSVALPVSDKLGIDAMIIIYWLYWRAKIQGF